MAKMKWFARMYKYYFRGRVVAKGNAQELLANELIRETYLGL